MALVVFDLASNHIPKQIFLQQKAYQNGSILFVRQAKKILKSISLATSAILKIKYQLKHEKRQKTQPKHKHSIIERFQPKQALISKIFSTKSLTIYLPLKIRRNNLSINRVNLKNLIQTFKVKTAQRRKNNKSQ